MPALPEPVAGFISAGRVGRLGTADADGDPLVVPFCYAWDGEAIFSAIDAKPKRGAAGELRRVRNIRANPKVSVVIDEYDEDWSRLRWVIIQGRAEILTGGPGYRRGTELLLDKYPQYRRMGLPPEPGTMIKVTPARISHWSFTPMSALDRALARAASGRALDAAHAETLLATPDERLPELLAPAAALRDRGHGRRLTFSAKVFVPLTTLCRDYCGYCTFRKDPGQSGAHTMMPDEVIALVQAGERLGAKEALFSLGDKPEALFPEHREFLRRMGFRTTLAYLRAVSERVVRESALLPHANPGLMSERDLSSLREVNVSMGIMLETTSERLLGPGLAHDRAPDKIPARRLKTIALAGKLQIPFTTGILIGIGETHAERVDALLAIRALHEQYGHIQEVIIQNFRAKPTIPMRGVPDPTLPELLRTLAVARLLLGAETNIQAPPNLADAGYGGLPAAGLNDWGGISPLTPDHINPERPWPLLRELRRATEAAGHELRERLAIYPEYTTRPEFLDGALRPRVAHYVGPDGLVRQDLERWRSW